MSNNEKTMAEMEILGREGAATMFSMTGLYEVIINLFKPRLSGWK